MCSHPVIRQICNDLASHPDLVILYHKDDDLFGDGIAKGAIFSSEEIPLYRYMLWRVWNDNLPVLVVIMLNPSTADHEEDDRTIMTVTARAKANNYGGLIVVNLFAWRATDPDDMKAADNPTGSYNDYIINLALTHSDSAPLCAWGVHGVHRKRNEEVRCFLEKKGMTPIVLKMSKEGHPEHPLYKSMSIDWFKWPDFMPTN